jgi:hypothetical protein
MATLREQTSPLVSADIPEVASGYSSSSIITEDVPEEITREPLPLGGRQRIVVLNLLAVNEETPLPEFRFRNLYSAAFIRTAYADVLEGLTPEEKAKKIKSSTGNASHTLHGFIESLMNVNRSSKKTVKARIASLRQEIRNLHPIYANVTDREIIALLRREMTPDQIGEVEFPDEHEVFPDNEPDTTPADTISAESPRPKLPLGERQRMVVLNLLDLRVNEETLLPEFRFRNHKSADFITTTYSEAFEQKLPSRVRAMRIKSNIENSKNTLYGFINGLRAYNNLPMKRKDLIDSLRDEIHSLHPIYESLTDREIIALLRREITPDQLGEVDLPDLEPLPQSAKKTAKEIADKREKGLIAARQRVQEVSDLLKNPRKVSIAEILDAAETLKQASNELAFLAVAFPESEASETQVEDAITTHETPAEEVTVQEIVLINNSSEPEPEVDASARNMTAVKKNAPLVERSRKVLEGAPINAAPAIPLIDNTHFRKPPVRPMGSGPVQRVDASSTPKLPRIDPNSLKK